MSDKRGVAEIVAYVILISITFAIAALVFSWMRGYVSPTEEMVCEENIALIVKDYSYNCTTGNISLVLQNRGFFDVDGFILKGAVDGDVKAGNLLINNTGLFIRVGEEINFGFNSTQYCKDVGCIQKESVSENLELLDLQVFKIDNKKTILCKNIIIKQEIQCD